MLERGVIVSHETVRRWCATFCRVHANELHHCRPRRFGIEPRCRCVPCGKKSGGTQR